MTDADGRFAHDTFLVGQLIRPIANLYRVTADGSPVAFVRQKRLALKEDLRFFADEDEREELFRLKARSVMDLGTRYDVTTPDGVALGAIRKRFGRSLVRSTWDVLGADDAPVAWAQERSMAISLLRRGIELVPVADMVPIPYHFSIHVGDAVAGEVTRAFGVRDRYTLDLTGDPDRAIDRRVAVALAVGLDALQSR